MIPRGVENWTRCETRKRIGLMRTAAMSWAWIELGLWALRKLGLASFCRPAKRKVAPRKTRSGSSAHSASAQARTGAPRGSRRSGARA